MDGNKDETTVPKKMEETETVRENPEDVGEGGNKAGEEHGEQKLTKNQMKKLRKKERALSHRLEKRYHFIRQLFRFDNFDPFSVQFNCGSIICFSWVGI